MILVYFWDVPSTRIALPLGINVVVLILLIKAQNLEFLGRFKYI